MYLCPCDAVVTLRASPVMNGAVLAQQPLGLVVVLLCVHVPILPRPAMASDSSVATTSPPAPMPPARTLGRDIASGRLCGAGCLVRWPATLLLLVEAVINVNRRTTRL